MRTSALVAALLLIVVAVACYRSMNTRQVTVSEIDSTGYLPRNVDPELYEVGRRLLAQQQEAVESFESFTVDFAKTYDSTLVAGR